ncbi:AIM24 family protein [Candidatus Soleaferrea massiliensis]|uniref:AIM24 family protein n=1 Tax=Candidatus Soleaferrea massiliensis TaxID=1470354 RepID=UPI000693BA8C|nr:AIM24 family protein [Candidatus Soleaferrea massiliensis]
MIKSAVGTREHIQIIDSSENAGMRVEVLEYQKLLGSTNTNAAVDLYYMEKQNMRARQVAVHLNNDSVQVEPGAMSYFQGNLEMVSGVTAGNMLGRVFSHMTTGESFAQPLYRGSGMLVLEPSFEHFLVLEIDDEIIVDKGMFYCAQGSIEVKPIAQKSFSSAVAGGEGIFQIALRGRGLVVLECPVPSSEIDIIELNNDVLKVDGNFAVLRTGNIQFTVERSAKTLLGSAVSGEGLVNVYRGTGSVWLAPSIKIYNTINGARAWGQNSTKSMNMNTSNS